MSFYYPVLVDVPAFFVSILCLYAYLENKSKLLLLAMPVGFFVFPGLFVVAALLYLFPKDMVRRETRHNLRTKIVYLVILFLGVVILSYLIYALVIPSTVYGWTSVNPINDAVFWVSYTALVAYLAYVLYCMQPIDKAITMIRFFRGKQGAVVILLYSFLSLSTYGLSNGKVSHSFRCF